MNLRRAWLLFCIALATAAPASAQDAAPNAGTEGFVSLTGLSEPRPAEGIGDLHMPITTAVEQAQAFFDQGLCYQHSYVYMEAARSFEHAARIDPTCAMAYCGLSEALDSWGRGDQARQAIQRAQELIAYASPLEERMIRSRALVFESRDAEAGDREAKLDEARRLLDEVIALAPDLEEAWMQRAYLAESTLVQITYYQAVLRINPRHAGAHHRLVHAYEGIGRPALGFPHSQGYIDAAPNVPHAHHMQCHLATRLGRWDRTVENSYRAIELEQAYHRDMGVDPRQDWQYPHHLEILCKALIHEGRFQEARAIRDECLRYGWQHYWTWAQLYLAERDWNSLLHLGEARRASDAHEGAYFVALAMFGYDAPQEALLEIEFLERELSRQPSNQALQYRVWALRGMYLCRTGGSAEGLSMVWQAVLQSRDDYGAHAWGGGAFYMELYGLLALECGDRECAQEGFLEAIAHDPGSVRAALGLQVLAEAAGSAEEASYYADMAARFWSAADPGTLAAERACFRDAAREGFGELPACVD